MLDQLQVQEKGSIKSSAYPTTHNQSTPNQASIGVDFNIFTSIRRFQGQVQMIYPEQLQPDFKGIKLNCWTHTEFGISSDDLIFL